MTPDERLKAAFAADEPPARDFGFSAAVMQGVARRQFQLSILKNVPIMLALMAVLWSAAPALEPLSEHLITGLQPVLAVLAVVVFVALVSLRMLKPAMARR